MFRMHRLAIATLLLAGCLGAQTRQCENGATCPFDEVCTEVPIESGEALCGQPRLVEACEKLDNFAACDFTTAGSQDGVCHGGVCGRCSVETAGCQYPGWSAMASGTTMRLRAVWASKLDEAFAVGEGRTFLYYDGSQWHASKVDGTAIGDAAALTGVWGTASGVFVTSGDGKVVRGVRANGAFTWTDEASATQLLGIGGSGPNDVVAVGLDGTTGVVLHFNGTSWTKLTVPSTTVILRSVYVIDAMSAWAVGNQGAIVRRVNGTWEVSSPQISGLKPLNGIWGAGDDAFAVSDAPMNAVDPLILRFENQTWGVVSGLDAFSGLNLSSVWSADGQVFVTGAQGTLLRFDGTSWTSNVVGTTLDLDAISGTSPSNVLAVGVSGNIFRYTGQD
jgi:hypothetical protein